MPNNDTNVLIRIVSALFKAFCGGDSKPNQQQQYGNYNQQQQPQQQQWNQQQQAYPPQQQGHGYPGQGQGHQQQNQQSWSQVASGPPGQHQNGQYQSHPNQHHGKPHHSNNQQHHNNNQQHHNNNQQHQNNNYQNQNQFQNQHNGGYPSKPHGLPAGGIIGPHHQGGQDPNMVNQANEKYVAMRNQARHEGDEAHRCFAASQEAYKSGDGQKAHELSMEGKDHAKKQDDIDEEAANWIYYANNTDSPPGTIDLHGLYVQEAITRTEAAIAQAQQSGQEEIQIIVGKGIHSKGHQAKLKPAVEDLMRKYNLSAHLDPHNAGVLVVDLQGRQVNGRTRDAGGLVDEMERKEGDDCIIM